MTNRSRRRFLQAVSSIGLGAAVGQWRETRTARAQSPERPVFFVNLVGLGGYSMHDAFMAIRESEAGEQRHAINTYPDGWIDEIGAFRALSIPASAEGASVRESFQPTFLRRHGHEMALWTQRASSVNHLTAQARSMTGNRAWAGRTYIEAIAAHRGAEFPLPNVNMASSGFAKAGVDPSIPAYARPVAITEPRLFALGTHAYAGLRPSWGADAVDLARRLRGEVEAATEFEHRHRNSPRLGAWKAQRARAVELEREDLIQRLNVIGTSEDWPFADFGIQGNADQAAIASTFPNISFDPLEAQAALAFLLIKNQVSVSVTLGPSAFFLPGPNGGIVNFGSAFDGAHSKHRPCQSLMWNRILRVADGLIHLLKSAEFENGESFWDRTVLYMPSEFGRVQRRPGNTWDFGSAHDFQGANIMISPRINGGQLFGGIDRTTGDLLAFDPQSSTPTVDPSRPGIDEKEGFAAVLDVMGVPTTGSGLEPVTFLRR